MLKTTLQMATVIGTYTGIVVVLDYLFPGVFPQLPTSLAIGTIAGVTQWLLATSTKNDTTSKS